MSTSTAENDSYSVENWDTETLIDFLKEQNLKLDEDDFKILRKKKINGQSFLLMNEEKLERCGLETGPALLLTEVIKSLNGSRKRLFSSYHSLKEVLAKYNIDDNGIDTICQFSPSNDKKLQQYVRETKPNMSEQETNITSIVSLSPKKSTSTQTMNNSANQKSLTYLIQGLISRSLSHFNLDVGLIFISGKTEGVCKISSVDPRLSSVSLYCEYELGNCYIHQPPPRFSGYPIVLKSPFSSIGIIVTGLDRSKTKFIDNINYDIEFIEMVELEELVKSKLNISDPPTGKKAGQIISAVPQTKTVATQTKPCVEDKKELTYIAKGIMFKSICWFTWGEHEAFLFGKKEGKLRLVSGDPKLAGMTLTCYYKLSKRILNFQGDLGYPMIVSCSYGSVKTLLTLDQKKIMDNFNYNLTFIS